MPERPSREAVKTLAIAVGYREAARQTGIAENTLLSWARRGNWSAQVREAKAKAAASPHNQSAQSTAIIPPSQALTNTLQEHSRRSRSALASAVTKGAEHLAGQPAERLVGHTRALKELASTGSIVHQWEEKQPGANVMVNIALLGVDPEQVTTVLPDISTDATGA